MDILQEITQTLLQIKARKPLVHHLTNFVSVNDCANITLAIGASPVMANDISEVEEMVSCASALVLNIGAINAPMIESMLAAGKKASALSIPIVFDPVGVGATRFRTETAERIISEIKPSVIKGNMSEIKVLAGFNSGIRGVDSIADEQDGERAAAVVAEKYSCVTAITGKVDIIARGNQIIRIYNGHKMLTGVTGTGCMTTSLVASCCAVEDYLFGTAAGVTIMGIAGEIAVKQLEPKDGLGTFRMRLFDVISKLTPDDVLNYGRVS